MKKMNSMNLQKVKDFIFSRKCSICGRIVNETGRYLCVDCCSILKKKGQIKNVENYFFLFYYEKDIKNVIADYKLKNRRNLSIELGFFVKKPLINLIKEKEIDIIIPVPISKERYRERGFNQVELLLETMNIPYEKIEKIRNTKHMYDLLDEKSREENIKNAFYNYLDLNDKNILLVDDIVTTGKTIQEIINELYKNTNPKNIFIFSIALSKVFKKI
ncbi:competence protein ComFC [Fusobacterium sp. PH5-44]|uniref:ComF family protein n=1 Tax=Fusobacterium sp. PH5-29 TaxID=1742400 RepID=UPI003D194188